MEALNAGNLSASGRIGFRGSGAGLAVEKELALPCASRSTERKEELEDLSFQVQVGTPVP